MHNKGTALFDYDNDGFLDVLVSGGLAGHSGQGIAVGDVGDDGKPGPVRGREPRQNHLYHNRGNGTFEEVVDNPMIETIKIEGGKVEINGSVDQDRRRQGGDHPATALKQSAAGICGRHAELRDCQLRIDSSATDPVSMESITPE